MNKNILILSVIILCVRTVAQDSILYFDYVSDFHEGIAVVMNNNKFGAIDKTGELIVPYEFDFIWDFQQGRARVIKYSDGETRKLNVNTHGSDTTNTHSFYVSYDPDANGCTYGFIDKKGNIVTPIIYDYATDYYDYSIVHHNGKSGLIDTLGNIVIPIIYDRLFDACLTTEENNNLIGGVLDKKTGFIDITSGEVKIPFEYDEMIYATFSEGLTAIKKDGKYIYIDATGRERLANEWDFADNFHQGTAIADKDNSSYIIDNKGTVKNNIGKVIYYSTNHNDGIKVVSYGKENWAIYEGFDLISSKLDYNYVSQCSNNVFLVSKAKYNGKRIRYGCIDKRNNIIMPIMFKEIQSYPDGYYVVKKGRKKGYYHINDTTSNATIAIKPSFQEADGFYEGLARVVKKGKYGFIDTNGKVVIPCEFDYARSFHEGMASVKINGKWSFIDKEGNLKSNNKSRVAR